MTDFEYVRVTQKRTTIEFLKILRLLITGFPKSYKLVKMRKTK